MLTDYLLQLAKPPNSLVINERLLRQKAKAPRAYLRLRSAKGEREGLAFFACLLALRNVFALDIATSAEFGAAQVVWLLPRMFAYPAAFFGWEGLSMCSNPAQLNEGGTNYTSNAILKLMALNGSESPPLGMLKDCLCDANMPVPWFGFEHGSSGHFPLDAPPCPSPFTSRRSQPKSPADPRF